MIKFMSSSSWLACAVASIGLQACVASKPMPVSDLHLQAEPQVLSPPPALVQAPSLPPPQSQQPLPETYTVVVHRVAVDELLFALARDAKLNIDIQGKIAGTVTINAIDQTLIQILDRISLQVPLRYQVDAERILIAADEPYLHTYQIEYLNMRRNSESRIDMATQIGTVGSASQESKAGSNNSQTTVTNVSSNNYWDSLIANVAALLREAPPVEGQFKPDGNIIVNRETGFLTVRASQRQHREIQAYLDKVAASGRRQVLIEATILEVVLNDSHKSGVDWDLLSSSGTLTLTQSMLGSALSAAPFFSAAYSETGTSIGDVTATIKALQQFGDVKVLSSPKIIALNNQTAILKVVDNRVYFTTNVEESTTDKKDTTTFETELHTVPVGFVMNVTPYISEKEEVLLNVRPTISRILGFVNDPNPALAAQKVESPIPEIQVREMEAMLRVNSGQIAVLGGLMQDKVDKKTSSVPLLSAIPLLGQLFRYQQDIVDKTELVVFIRPRVIQSADVNTELADFRRYLPSTTTE